MSQYHSNVLRDLATWLKDRPDDVVKASRIWINILNSSADRIDELQRQVGYRLEQNARLSDEVNHLKKETSNVRT